MARSEEAQTRRADNPYPGPVPFEPQDERRFFGRKEESSELGYLIAAHPAVLLYAQSGAGKTSLLNAGLRPILNGRNIEVLPLARVGSPAPPNVDSSRISNIFAFSAIASWFSRAEEEEEAKGTTEVPDWMPGATLAQGLERIPRQFDELKEPVTRIMILDQFEEIFYASAERWQERHALFEQVAAALKADSSLRVVFAIREEYLASFDAEAGLLPEAVRTRYRLERLRKTAALAAVEQPLQATNVRFEAGVAKSLVEDLLKEQVEDSQGRSVAVEGEFVEPVQLQLVCHSLFNHIPPSSTRITAEHVRAFGNPDEALQAFYQQALAATLTGVKVNEADLREWFQQQLITPALTRGTVFRGKETTGGIPNEAVTTLEAYHIIRAEYRSGSRWYELTHDRFIRPILKSNLAWQSERATGNLAVVYEDALREALKQTGVEEGKLRGWFDSLYTATGVRAFVKAEGFAPATLMLLAEKQLIKADSRGYYGLSHDALVPVVQKSNQAWKAEQWSAARNLRNLESRAAEWSSSIVALRDPATPIPPGAKTTLSEELLLQGEALAQAEDDVRATRAAGILHTLTLDEFLKASREQARRNLTIPLGFLTFLQIPFLYWLSASLFGSSGVAGIHLAPGSVIPVSPQVYGVWISAIAAELGSYIRLVSDVTVAMGQRTISWRGVAIWMRPITAILAGAAVNLVTGYSSKEWTLGLRAMVLGTIVGFFSDRIFSQTLVKFEPSKSRGDA